MLPRAITMATPTCAPVIQSSAVIFQATPDSGGFAGWRVPLRPLHADNAAADSRPQVTRLQSLRLGLPVGSKDSEG